MKKLLALLLAAVFSISCIGCGGGQTGDVETQTEAVTEAPVALEDQFRYIMHAGGVTEDGKTGSNSIEAIDFTYKRGYRTIEIDFCWTEDGQLVCVHDWAAYYAASLGKSSVTMEEFENMRYGLYGFTSLTLNDVAAWLNEHPDAVIVTDIKERNVEAVAMIANQYPDLKDRFIIQIYSKDEFESVYLLGFKNIILTVYQMTWNEKTDTAGLVEFARSHELAGLTYPIELHDWNAEYTKSLLAAEIPLYVHTVNDIDRQEELFAAGIFGVYTDNGKS